MTAKGKINASKVQAGDRIIVRNVDSNLERTDTVRPSETKTGDGVRVARVIGKELVRMNSLHYTRRAVSEYLIHTTSGSFRAAPIQTMWLAPEDAAGIKRAYAEAIGEQSSRWKAGLDEIWDEALAADEAYDRTMALAEQVIAERADLNTLPDPDGSNILPVPTEFFQGELTDEDDAAADKRFAQAQAENLSEAEQARTENEAPGGIYQERTGSAVVRLLERVWTRIRENHPELPDVVIVTGSGTAPGAGSKWGHFRPNGWTAKAAAEEGARINLHEMFMAGETLAKGARQVLQTMLHEGAHTLAKVREISDTSRQGRWHNAKFRELAGEMGLEHRGASADKSHGYSFVTLTEATAAEYADLLDALDREIHLMVQLPGWLGGTGEEDKGGEGMGRPPAGEGSSSGNVKLTCKCEEPNIIRASKKVAELMVVRCDDCEHLFKDRG